MTRHYLCFLGVILLPGLLCAQQPTPKRPNFVLILVDDLGWSDLACYGGDLHDTPNIDHLVTQSVRFTDAYAPSPVCTPTRASLLTGEHPARLHMTVWREAAKNPPRDRPLIPPATEENLPLSKITLAERFQAAGYGTAHIGKWHLGDASHYPQTQGFDVGIGGTHWGCPTTFFYPFRGVSHGDFRYVPGLAPGDPGDYLTDRLTDKAIEFVNQMGAAPFFLYMAYYTVHTPIEAPSELVERYREKVTPGLKHANATYAAMVSCLDQNVGRILKAITDSELDDNTIVILTSDNGGFINPWRDFPAVTNNAPLRSGKGSLYEGGIRVPLIIKWPGVTQSNTVCRKPTQLTDLYRTIVEGIDLNVDQTPISRDSVNLMPLLTSVTAQRPARDLFWHYPHYYPTTTPVSAMRRGNWKLIEYLESGQLELYDLQSDIGEKNNVAADNPRLASEMKRTISKWRTSVKAQMPTVNPAAKRGPN